jgi:8-oxo-dGTP pyrophosphatase MutT (NUDIX family)
LEEFKLILGLPGIDEGNVVRREAVRAVVLHDNKLLMVRTNAGSYSFPGGGVEPGESHEDALRREVREETGYLLSHVKDKLGETIERRTGRRDVHAVFYMDSHYYLCELSGTKTARRLEEYEKELGFQPVWIGLENAIDANETVINGNGPVHPWVYRETRVLKELSKLSMINHWKG